MARQYVLAKGAAADLQEITRYTSEQWGEVKSLTYIRQREKPAVAVAKGEGAFKHLASVHPQLRMARSGRDYIFCLPRSNALPVLLAILHERMDIMARLRSRLI